MEVVTEHPKLPPPMVSGVPPVVCGGVPVRVDYFVLAFTLEPFEYFLCRKKVLVFLGTTLRSIEEVASSRKKSHYTILILQIVICCLVSSFVVRLANQNLDNELIQVRIDN